MRPMRLSLNAFGPFRGRVDVDLERLASRGVFLITGPTGAGKTSLLDALCYALYDTPSGATRETSGLRCKSSDPSEDTWAELEFDVGGLVYRVHRSLTRDVPKKRGTGTTKQEATAALWRIEANGEAVPVAEKPTRLTEEITRLLGFDARQFRQLLVLPQGEFQRALLAKPNEREESLKVLFRTGRWELLQQAARDHAKRATAKREESGRLIAQLRATLGLEPDAAIDGLLTLGEEEVRQRAEATARALASKDAAATSLKLGEEAAGLIIALRAAAAEWVNRTKMLEALAPLRIEVEAARRAAGIGGIVQAAREAEQRRDEAAQKERDAAYNADVATERADQCTQALDGESQRDADREKLAAELVRLEPIARDWADWKEAQGIAANAAIDASASAKDLAGAQKALESASAKLADDERLYREAVDAAKEMPLARAAEERARGALESVTRASELERRISVLRSERDKMEAELGRARATENDAQQSARRLEAAWRSQVTVRLAATLSDGQPCPVCGAAHHPHPATLSGGQGVSDAELDAAVKETERRAGLREQAEAALRAAVSEVEKAQTLRMAMEEQMPEERSIERLTAAANDARATVARLEATAGSVDTRSKSVDAARRGVESALERAERARTRDEDTRQRRDEAKALAEDRARRVPEDLRAEGALERTKANLEHRLGVMRDAKEKAVRMHAEALAHRDKAAATLIERTATRQAADRAAAENADRRAAGLRDAGFDSMETYLASARPEEWIKKSEAEIRSAESNVAVATRRRDEAAVAAEGREMPAIEDLREAARATEAAWRHAADEESRSRERVTQRRGVAEKLGELQREAVAATSSEELALRVNNLLIGGAGSRTQATLHRHVLATHLDDVLGAATSWMRKLAKGERYELRRDPDPDAPLTILVHDTFAQATRPVGTLSGGETFLASLALSLGLADIARDRVGQRRLEMLLLDEGFGSLDAATLDDALVVLGELHQAGMTVGVISHVSEMAERMTTRLVVEPGVGGSVVRIGPSS